MGCSKRQETVYRNPHPVLLFHFLLLLGTFQLKVGTMEGKLDFPLHGPSLNIVRQCGPGLSDILQSKFGCVAIFEAVDFERDVNFSQYKKPKVVPEKRFAVKLKTGVEVSVWKADLTNFKVDAVVNAANTGLQHYGGLALALSQAGGPQIQRESDDYIKRKGTLNTGDAVIGGAGLLPCKGIIHAVGPQLKPYPTKHEFSQAEPLLKKAIRSILDIVQKNSLKSVAIPAISSGLFNYPLPECANTIVSTVKHYYENVSRQSHLPEKIFLVNHDDPSVNEMMRACHQILVQSSSKTYSQAAAPKTSTHTVQLGNVRLILGKGKIEDQQTDVIQGNIGSTADPIRFSIGMLMDGSTFKAFEEQMRSLQRKASQSNFTQALEHKADFHDSKPPTPQISLRGDSDETVREAERWLSCLLKSSKVTICNNFILRFGEEEYQQLSRLTKNGVSIDESFDRGRAEITVRGSSPEDVVVAGLQVEAALLNVQKEFVREEENAMCLMSTKGVSFDRKTVDSRRAAFSDRSSQFEKEWLRMVKLEQVENKSLEMLFNLKKTQLNCLKSQTMFQLIPAQFREMVSHTGFHTEYAPPTDPAYGEGIYFASTVRKAMEVWKERNEEYLYFVEAEVLTGESTLGKPGLILPPTKLTDPHSLYDSVNGGRDISVIFSGYQALPKYIITCKSQSESSHL
ncbi:poly [ADP-ribose] [Lates japonicus]|uniref:Poly [ADP-ribose] n=1 Tax=Lates japonicus TaxID=270547 RepID=A0AAD3NFL7_LATJO|nr:poly [ADP-ribose] [Lates japonicus]GLD71079.1 poly [ADP-ribose] [Lates japonicus]